MVLKMVTLYASSLYGLPANTEVTSYSTGTSITIVQDDDGDFDFGSNPTSLTVPSSGRVSVIVWMFNRDNEDYDEQVIYFKAPVTYSFYITKGSTVTSGTIQYKIDSGSWTTISSSTTLSISQGSTVNVRVTNIPSGKACVIYEDNGAGQDTYNSSTWSNTFNSGYVFGITIQYITTTVYYTISASAGSGGSISPSGSVQVESGTNKSFTITANTNYLIDKITLDGTTVHNGGVKTANYTISNVTANHTLVASFKNAVVISVTKGSSVTSGTVQYKLGSSGTWETVSSGSVNVTVPIGTTLYVQGINPPTGKSFYILENNGAGQDTYHQSSWSQTINNDYVYDITVQLETTVFIINASAGTGGSISPSGEVPVSYGGSRTFQVTPNSGYIIDEVTLDETPIDPDS